MADFREQLLCCAGVDPARIVEFSCGECDVLAGRAQQCKGCSLLLTLFCQHSKQCGIFSKNQGSKGV